MRTNGVPQRNIFRGIYLIQTTAQHRHRFSLRFDGAPVAGGIDSLGHTADHHRLLLRQPTGNLGGHPHSIVTATAASHHGDGERSLQTAQISQHIKHRRNPVDVAQQFRKQLVLGGQNLAANLRTPADRLLRLSGIGILKLLHMPGKNIGNLFPHFFPRLPKIHRGFILGCNIIHPGISLSKNLL